MFHITILGASAQTNPTDMLQTRGLGKQGSSKKKFFFLMSVPLRRGRVKPLSLRRQELLFRLYHPAIKGKREWGLEGLNDNSIK